MRIFRLILAVAVVIVAIGGFRSGDLIIPTIMLAIAVALVRRPKKGVTNGQVHA